MILDVVDGGLLTTVQDGGRPDWTHLGVPVSGAADPWSLAVANLLVGNEPDAAALELTVVGPTVVARVGGLIAIAGAELGGRIAGDRRLLAGHSHRIVAGERIGFEGGPSGARAYVAVSGGIDVPVVLGSRSTCLAGGFGGLEGRALNAGDVVASAGRPSGDPERSELTWPMEDDAGRPRLEDEPIVLRVLPGPADGLDDLCDGDQPWRVSGSADRVGVRLEGRTLPDGIGGEAVTQGVTWGAIQVPPDGGPILLSADHQTTGGYRVVGVVISADRPVLGQLRPGDPVRLVRTDLATADDARRARKEALDRGASALSDAAGWERLAASAGG